MNLAFLALFFVITLAAQALAQQLPTTDGVVTRMMEHNRERQAIATGYSSFRRYVLKNERHHRRAEMLVRMNCSEDGSKQFDTIHESGWGGARRHVFPRLLKSVLSRAIKNDRV